MQQLRVHRRRQRRSSFPAWALGVAGAAAAIVSAAHAAADSLVTPADVNAATPLFDRLLGGQTVPFSFNYAGRPIADQLAGWNPQTDELKLDENRTQRTTTWKDPQTGLTIRLVAVRYGDFPAAEWTVYLRNDGTADSKTIEAFNGIDAAVSNTDSARNSEKRKALDAAASFPAEARGGAFELSRGWLGAWRPIDKESNRFATNGNAPFISRDPGGDGILMTPGQGIEGAGDDPNSGKSPAISYVAPADGVYRVSGSVADIGQGGDGVEWFVADGDNRVVTHGAIDDKQSARFESTIFIPKGQRTTFTIHSRTTADGDQCRVKFAVTQLTDLKSGDVVLHTNKGSDARDFDYQPLDIGVGAGETVKLTSWGGRPSDFTTLPYFNVEVPGGTNAVFAIGWPGQWAAQFSRRENDLRFTAGQEGVKLVLHPGEEIRSPLIALIPYTGSDEQRGQNLWRRWMVAHNLPRVDGQHLGSIVNGNSSHQFNEMLNANEENQKQYIDRYLEEQIKIDYWWMDAGWYVNNGTWVNTGTWKVDPRRFPNGLRAITDHGRSKGVKSIVWFEPERVTRGTELNDEHKNFLLRQQSEDLNPSAGLIARRGPSGSEPCLVFNPTKKDRSAAGFIQFPPRSLALHPGPQGEESTVRFTAPKDGRYQVTVKFGAADSRATTDVHLIHAGKPLVNDFVRLNGKGNTTAVTRTINAKAGDTIDFAVGRGNGSFECDMTSLGGTITGPDGEKFDIAGDFKNDANPNGPWSYGYYPAPTSPNQPRTNFEPYARKDGSDDDDGGDWKLLNLGNPEAWNWITDRINSTIEEQGIDLYRQDFNIEPLGYWRGGDTPDRQGITENLYVQGYLRFWDEIRKRNPKIWIDSCASGGRRNDLETLRRGMPFLRSDRLFEPIGQQGHTFGISQWMPWNGTGVLVGKSDLFPSMTGGINPYHFRSTMAPGFTLAVKVTDPDLDYNEFRRLLGHYRDFAPDYFGDYYPLTKHSLAPDQWIAWQFHLPEKNEGFVQAFRRQAAGESTLHVKLQGLDPKTTYEVVDVDHAERTVKRSGAELGDGGIDVTIDAQPGSAVLRYRVAR